MSERHEIVDALVVLGRPNLVRKVEAYFSQLEAENEQLKAAIEEWKKEEILRAGLALKQRKEQDHE